MPYLVGYKDQPRLVIWHIPKSGGTSVRTAIQAISRRDESLWIKIPHGPHAKPLDVREQDSGLFALPQALIVRDPWRWYWSAFWYLQRRHANDVVWQLVGGMRPEHLDRFGDFVLAHVGSYKQIVSVYHVEGAEILKTETVLTDTASLLRRHGLIDATQAERIRGHSPQNQTGRGDPPPLPTLARYVREVDGLYGQPRDMTAEELAAAKAEIEEFDFHVQNMPPAGGATTEIIQGKHRYTSRG